MVPEQHAGKKLTNIKIVNLITRTNLLHFTITYTLLKLKASTCFGHHLSILRRHYTNSFGEFSMLQIIIESTKCTL
jgi:hypothetical protein